jgi:hypothetical protein
MGREHDRRGERDYHRRERDRYLQEGTTPSTGRRGTLEYERSRTKGRNRPALSALLVNVRTSTTG